MDSSAAKVESLGCLCISFSHYYLGSSNPCLEQQKSHMVDNIPSILLCYIIGVGV